MSGQSTVSAPVPSPAVIDTMTKVIMSQTDMTEEEVKIALEHTNYDLKRVIREYMRGEAVETANVTDVTKSSSAEKTSTSTNQMRFSEIRSFMDKSAQQYYRQQEMTKIYNQVLERKKAEAAAAAAATSAGTSSATGTTETTTEAISKL